MRLVEFIAEDYDSAASLLETSLWADLERRLHGYVTNYHKKIVRVRDDQFQF
jgi:hypothetical protein